MDLTQAKLSTNVKIKNIEIKDEKIRLRLKELGLFEGVLLKVKKRSLNKKTFLIHFNNTCFTLSGNLAKEIEVEYA